MLRKRNRIGDINHATVKAIRSIRQHKGIKQVSMAYALNMPRTSYTKLEQGCVPLTLEQFYIICAEFRMSIPQVLEYSQKISPVETPAP